MNDNHDELIENRYKSVKDAALYLDVFCPEWYKHINVVSLDLRHNKRCIVGQLRKVSKYRDELDKLNDPRDILYDNYPYLRDWKNEVAKRLKENTNKSVDQEKRANPPENAGDRILFYNYDEQQFYLGTLEEMKLGDKIKVVKTKATDDDLELCNTVHNLVEEECC